jgi:hypothetical protein
MIAVREQAVTMHRVRRKIVTKGISSSLHFRLYVVSNKSSTSIGHKYNQIDARTCEFTLTKAITKFGAEITDRYVKQQAQTMINMKYPGQKPPPLRTTSQSAIVVNIQNRGTRVTAR